jgi:murein DD-endopeptidase MepM/ murein hydrolase activator NlpD
MMPKKSIHILVVSEEDGVSSTLQFKKQFLRRLSIAALLLAIAVVAGAIHYSFLLWTLDDRASLERHNQELAASLRSIESKLKPMEKQVRLAQKLSQKLLLLATSASVPETDPNEVVPETSGDFLLSLSALKEMEAQQIESRILSHSTQSLSSEIQKQVLSLSQLIDHFQDKGELRAMLPSIHPVKGWLSSPFGVRTDPYSGEPTHHTGADFAAPEGTVVVAPAFGRVVFFGSDGMLGNLLVIDHGLGFQTQYAHLKQALVETGNIVKRGQPIAQVGNTGKSTGPHLHYEIRKFGIPVNPTQYMID